MLPYWLEPFFTYLPVYGWFFLGIGLPWALALLPRRDWADRWLVITVGMALGPMFGTAWLFALGTWGTFSLSGVLIGTVAISIVGCLLAYKRTPPLDPLPLTREGVRQENWQITLLIMLFFGFLAHVWITMFMPFVQYDTLWTFGYNARVFLVFDRIPDWIGYYPQLVPLTYTYGQLFTGEMNDHVAKASVPWFVLASILMAYQLGQKMWGSRSTGLLTAALWFLIPTALYWSGTGDLEHVMALYFTGAVLFFVLAWREDDYRYALLSGLLFGGAMWTKPTAGSFALGVMLVVGFYAAYQYYLPSTPLPRQGEGIKGWGSKFTLAAITGVACLPLGSLWYIRNLIYGHPTITFPADHWRDIAQRSGQEFGWLILIVVLAVGYTMFNPAPLPRQGEGIKGWGLWLGIVLLLLGTLPNAINLDLEWDAYSLWQWTFGQRPAAGRLSLIEIALIVIGLILLAYGLRPYWQKLSLPTRTTAILLALLIAPFTLVWFYSYSYHYRLMLTITPVLASFTAVLIDSWLIPLFTQNRVRRSALHLLIVLLCLPGIVIASWLTFMSTFVEPLHTDLEKYRTANPALMDMVQWLISLDERTPETEAFHVYTLGEQRVNFFFPHLRTIYQDELPTDLDAIRPGTDAILGSSTGDFLWKQNGLLPNQISAYMQLAFQYSQPWVEYGHTIPIYPATPWYMPIFPMFISDDGNNKFIAYELSNERRVTTADIFQPPLTFTDVTWDFLALRALDFRSIASQHSASFFHDFVNEVDTVYDTALLPTNQEIFIQLYWQRTDAAPIPKDYSIFLHLRPADSDEIVTQRDSFIAEGTLPMTLLPYPDIIIDRRTWAIPDLPPGKYDLFIGIYDYVTGQRVPVLVEGQPVGDGFLLEDVIEIGARQ